MGSQLPGREEVFAAVERTLGRPEFQPPELSFLEQAWVVVQDALREVQRWVLRQIGEWIGGDERLGTVVLVLLFVALAGLLLYTIWSFLGRQTSLSERPLPAAASDSEVLPRAHDWSRRAHELARSGRYGEAMRVLYHGVLLWLDESGQARYEDDKTGGEYADEIRGRELRPSFRSLLRAFYPVAYGGRPPVEAAWSKMADAAAELGVPR